MAQQYVVTAPMVSVKTMTIEGPRLINLYTGAPVPADADPGWVERHLEAKMIAAVGNPEEVSVPVLSPLEMQEANAAGIGHHEEVYNRVTEQEKSLGRSRAAQKAADTRRENEQADAKAAADEAAKARQPAVQPDVPVKAEPLVKPADPAKPVVGRPVSQPGTPGNKAGK